MLTYLIHIFSNKTIILIETPSKNFLEKPPNLVMKKSQTLVFDVTGKLFLCGIP